MMFTNSQNQMLQNIFKNQKLLLCLREQEGYYVKNSLKNYKKHHYKIKRLFRKTIQFKKLNLIKTFYKFSRALHYPKYCMLLCLCPFNIFLLTNRFQIVWIFCTCNFSCAILYHVQLCVHGISVFCKEERYVSWLNWLSINVLNEKKTMQCMLGKSYSITPENRIQIIQCMLGKP